MELKKFKDLLRHYGADLTAWPKESEARELLEKDQEARYEIEQEKMIEANMKALQAFDVPSTLADEIVNQVIFQGTSNSVEKVTALVQNIESFVLSKLGISMFVLFLSILCWFSLKQGAYKIAEKKAPKFSTYLFQGLKGDPYGY